MPAGAPHPSRRAGGFTVRLTLALCLSALAAASAPAQGPTAAIEEATPTAPPSPPSPAADPTTPSPVEAAPTAAPEPPTLPPLPTVSTREEARPAEAPTFARSPLPADASAETAARATRTSTASPTPTATRRRPSRTPTPTPRRIGGLARRALESPFGFDPRLSGAAGGIGRDTLTAFAGGALAVLLGLVLGIASASLASGARRREAKRAAATAMLAELRWIDAVLRRVADQGSSASDLCLDHPIIAAGLGNLALFEPETAGRIADLHYHLRGVDYEMQRYRDNPKAWAGRLPELDRLVRHKAVNACRLVPELSKALRREGGALPPVIAAGEESGGEGELPPTPFGEGESDDWTL